MDRACLDVGLDMSLDAIMSRAEQLVKLEADALAERTTHVYKLQRKVSMKWIGWLVLSKQYLDVHFCQRG